MESHIGIEGSIVNSKGELIDLGSSNITSEKDATDGVYRQSGEITSLEGFGSDID